MRNNAFFASIFKSKTSYPQDTQPHELEERNREQNKAPIIQEDMLHHLEKQKSMGSDGIQPGVLGSCESDHQATFHNLAALLISWRGPS